MATEEKIIKIVDATVATRQASVEQVGSQGALVVKSVSGTFVSENYDTVNVTYPTTSSEVYTYLSGASTVATVTVTYSDAVTKEILLSIVRT